MHNKIYRVLFCGSLSLIGITIVTGSLLSNIVPSATAESSSTATATVNVSSSCSLSATVDAEHTATLLNGIYSGNDNYPNGIGSTTIKAVCNDNAGFAIYAVGFSGDIYGDNTMIGTSGATIPTGTATSGANSQWAMKLAKVTDSTAYNPANLTITNSFDSYHAVPNKYTKVASFSSSTDQTLGSKLTATYAAFISANQAADTYTGKVKYTMVHPASALPETPAQPVACDGGKICYSPGPSSVTDSMGDQSVSNSATSAVLWASNFKREGYGFAGWTDKYNWVLGANDASGNGTGANAGYHIYGPNATITFTARQYSTEGLSLYAVWVPSAGNLQNWTCPNNTAMPIGTVTALTDQRDNDTYAVAKLADGKCWMIENLRLDYDADFTESLSQGFGKSTTYGNFIGLAKPETANFTSNTTANSIYYSGTQSGTATININTTNYPEYRMPRYRNDNTNTDSTTNPNTTVANMTGTNQNIYSYGNYYTWSAALANTIYYNSPTATDADGKTSETVNTSLCPAGWKLPRGGDKSREATNDSWSLIVTGINNGTNPANYDSDTIPCYTSSPEGTNASIALRSYPNNFLYSGGANGSSVGSRGTLGSYWSPTANNGYFSYGLTLSSSAVYPGTYYSSNYVGFSIRCLAGS
ncbi:hypothetical protein IKX73_00010 [Candidatus Saccharibacteria bacterium]|nr:hypothetical protein [Candidatus Saccharibacteria bacterium]